MPYMEMAGHCEALSAGKQKKMSALMSQQSVIKVSACDQIQPMQGYEHNQAVEMSTDFHFQQVLYIHLQSYIGYLSIFFLVHWKYLKAFWKF